ncbi:MAG: hypothetical protein ACXVA2_18405 [Mucilaginibacter sp.]
MQDFFTKLVWVLFNATSDYIFSPLVDLIIAFIAFRVAKLFTKPPITLYEDAREIPTKQKAFAYIKAIVITMVVCFVLYDRNLDNTYFLMQRTLFTLVPVVYGVYRAFTEYDKQNETNRILGLQSKRVA